MRGLNTATVIDLLNGLRADRNPELTATAAGRSTGIAAAAAATQSLASAITDVADTICTLRADPSRRRTGAHWRDVRHACDLAAERTSGLADQLTGLAAEALLLVTDMEPVHYRGSIPSRHGPHVLAGPCGCRHHQHRGDRLRLSLLLDDLDDLRCVRPRSITAAPDEPHDLPLAAFDTALREAIAAVAPVPAAHHAICLVQNLSLFTGRTRTVVSSWATTIDQRLHGRFVTSLDGTSPADRHHSLTSGLVQAGATLARVQTDLHSAVTALRAIDAEPPRPAAPH
ncbi:hypothetical protein Q0Z83_110820 [Actinoplanes sichuanensis]|uniref:Uncharacterized protein n=1 Tax=Actinoplanes sichuanensis TaxID=512349 RepID=A0ABW4A1P7_9ACTN|nr:hypothetical protein [Actinoplanes sichuanensis]BEL12891.1 hypothetical protein Q0Z83_110820 [Actinoplanes sichuanensis]